MRNEPAGIDHCLPQAYRTWAGFDFLMVEDFAEDFEVALEVDLTGFFALGFAFGLTTGGFAFTARSLAAVIVRSKFAIIADFSLFTRVKSSTRICSSSLALFAALS